MPPSLFWRSSNHLVPALAAWVISESSPRTASARSAPAVSSPSGTPPGQSVHAQPPGADLVYGWIVLNCWSKSHRFRRQRSASVNASLPRALIESVVTHVARLVSIGQLPSFRTELTRKSSPRCVTGWLSRPIPIRFIVTKLVKGVASRKPPDVGWMDSNNRSVLPVTAFLRCRCSRFLVGWW